MKIFQITPAGVLAGPAGGFAVDEGSSCAHERDEVRSSSWRASGLVLTRMGLNATASPAARDPGPLVMLTFNNNL
ncbi:MAG TPA: hypothetical protein VE733_16285 [Streptosporangiaceae bacterium]|jgi:hypothetical protein|nr:hypothetical protein [Streptosporangiaceae bacterium]